MRFTALALAAGTLESLLKPENKGKLAAILTYDVVSGTVMAADVKTGIVTSNRVIDAVILPSAKKK